MPDITTGFSLGSTVLGGLMKGDAASGAGGIQSDAAMAGLQAQQQAQQQGQRNSQAALQRQLDEYRGLMSPYINAGTAGLDQKMRLLGLGSSNSVDESNPNYQKAYQDNLRQFIASGGNLSDPNAQRYLKADTLRSLQAGIDSGSYAQQDPAAAQAEEVAKFENSPYFQAITRQSEDAILQNASATGGLRGGNTQDALSKNRPIMLQGLIDKQIANLTGLTNSGQQAATSYGNAGIQTAGQMAGMFQQGAANEAAAYNQAGAAQAGGMIGKSNADIGMLGNIAGTLGQKFAGGWNPFGGGGGTPAWTGGGLKL
jgi:hypothetical protein